MALEEKKNSRIFNFWNTFDSSLANIKKLNDECKICAEFCLNLMEQRESVIKSNFAGTKFENLPNFRSILVAKIDVEISENCQKINENFAKFEENFQKSVEKYEKIGKFANSNQISSTESKILQFLDEIFLHFRDEKKLTEKFWTEFQMKRKTENLQKLVEILKPNENWNSRMKFIIAHVEMLKIDFNSSQKE